MCTCLGATVACIGTVATTGPTTESTRLPSLLNLRGDWVHWAFTKDAESGIMKMFVNGELWHSGGDKDNLIGDIVRMNLGGSWNGGVDYFGDVASFRVWDVAFNGATIQDWMDHAVLDGLVDHPYADRLLGALNMLGADGEMTDQGPLAGWMHGDAGRRPFTSREAFWIRNRST